METTSSICMAAHLSGRRSQPGCPRARTSDLPHSGLNTLRAARCAIWLISSCTDAARWLVPPAARAERLLAGRPDCVERGYLLVPSAIRPSWKQTSRRLAAYLRAGCRHRRAFRRRGPRQPGPAGSSPRDGAARRGGPGRRADGRGDDCRHLGRALAHHRRHHLLQRRRGLLRVVRHAPRAGMYRSARPLVRVPARHGCVSRGMLRSTRRDSRCCEALGRTRRTRPGTPAINSTQPTRRGPAGPPTTSSRRSIDCAGSSAKAKSTAWQATRAVRHIQAWPCCGSRRVVVTTQRRLSAGSSTRHAIAVPGPDSSDQPWKSCSRAVSRPRRVAPPRSCKRSRRSWQCATSVPSPRGRWAPC